MLKFEIEDKLDKGLVVKVWIGRIMLFKPCVKNYYYDPSRFHASTMSFNVCGIYGTHIIMYLLVTSPINGFISEKYPSQPIVLVINIIYINVCCEILICKNIKHVMSKFGIPLR
jgi:hypothetical protein